MSEIPIIAAAKLSNPNYRVGRDSFPFIDAGTITFMNSSINSGVLVISNKSVISNQGRAVPVTIQARVVFVSADFYYPVGVTLTITKKEGPDELIPLNENGELNINRIGGQVDNDVTYRITTIGGYYNAEETDFFSVTGLSGNVIG